MNSNLRTSNENSLAYKVREKYDWSQDEAARIFKITRQGWSNLESKDKISTWATITLSYVLEYGPSVLEECL